MCAFHHSRERDSLFEGERDRISCVRFTANKVVCASELKIQKFRNRDGALIGKS